VQGKVSRTWIRYNKPGEPNAVHAGLLFGLGLQGYLHVLNLSDIYQYFTQDHESTTVGLMLGLAASYRGTMQPDIAKALFFHVPARYQASYTEFEIPTLLQSAALVSVGMLFEGSAHQQTMQLLLGEIGRRSAGDNVLEREGYAVSAGFSLGLVALGMSFWYLAGNQFFFLQFKPTPLSFWLKAVEVMRSVPWTPWSIAYSCI
jgi:anaphase-promoting complex subunit 1